MYLFSTLLLAGATLVLALPQSRDAATPPEKYTLSAYAPANSTLNGLKAELSGDLWLYQKRVNAYCPMASGCPSGNETAFGGSLWPASMVPGGQNTYVAASGVFQVTAQHSSYIPANAYQTPIGWTYTKLADDEKTGLTECPTEDEHYNCDTPTGYYAFKAPKSKEGGLVACPKNDGVKAAAVIWAVTPSFNQTGCSELTGLATHNYTGEYPPVWSYF